MPTFTCAKGYSAKVALEEPGGFVVKDTRGRTWFCRERRPESREAVLEILRMQATAPEQDAKGIRAFVCDRSELPSVLGRMA